MSLYQVGGLCEPVGHLQAAAPSAAGLSGASVLGSGTRTLPQLWAEGTMQ